jgi:hypothetical protein
VKVKGLRPTAVKAAKMRRREDREEQQTGPDRTGPDRTGPDLLGRYRVKSSSRRSMTAMKGHSRTLQQTQGPCLNNCSL